MDDEPQRLSLARILPASTYDGEVCTKIMNEGTRKRAVPTVPLKRAANPMLAIVYELFRFT